MTGVMTGRAHQMVTSFQQNLTMCNTSRQPRTCRNIECPVCLRSTFHAWRRWVGKCPRRYLPFRGDSHHVIHRSPAVRRPAVGSSGRNANRTVVVNARRAAGRRGEQRRCDCDSVGFAIRIWISRIECVPGYHLLERHHHRNACKTDGCKATGGRHGCQGASSTSGSDAIFRFFVNGPRSSSLEQRQRSRRRGRCVYARMWASERFLKGWK